MCKNQNEKGITSKKYFHENAKVDLEFIQSDKFKVKFKKITDNEKINNVIYKICKSILIHRNGTYLEDIYLVDSKNGKIVAKQTHPMFPNEVYYDDEMNETIRSSEKYILISIHNHGTNIPPTGSDFVSCAQKKYKFGIVICHDGKIYLYKVGNTFVSASLIDKRVEKYKEKRYNLNVKEAHLKALEELKSEYDIEWREL